MSVDVVKAAEIVSAAAAILTVIIGGYKLYDKLLDRIQRLEEDTKELSDELNRVKKEDAIVIYALRACLDGLHQQGCNGKVTEAMQTLDKHLNKAAHDQD